MEDNNKQLVVSRKENAIAKYKTSLDILTQLNPTVCMKKYIDCVSVEQCLATKAITLNEIGEWYGADCSADLLLTQLASLNLFVNVSYHLTPDQIKQISFIILSSYSKLNLSEITLVITRIKKGEYGKLYSALSGEFILDCFASYDKEKRKFLFEKEKATITGYATVQEFGIAIFKNLENMPYTRAIMGKKITEEEQKKIEKEKREAEIKRFAMQAYQEERLKK